MGLRQAKSVNRMRVVASRLMGKCLVAGLTDRVTRG